MKEMMIYCPARDQDARVILTDDPVIEGEAGVFATELVCLEIGEACAGNMCPLCAHPESEMEARREALR